MAAVICKNLIANRSDARYADIWIQLEPKFKQQMKQAILTTLACQSQVVRKQSASLISIIASIEIPRGEWTDLIGNLCTNANHENLLIRLSSLQCLGFICEELDQSNLSAELKNSIVGALTTNISINAADPQGSLEASRLAIIALLNSLPYANGSF
jgi:importin subunit beta-1